MGLSENSVPLNPMVLLIIIPMKNGYFIGKINPTFSVTHPYRCEICRLVSPRFLFMESSSAVKAALARFRKVQAEQWDQQF